VRRLFPSPVSEVDVAAAYADPRRRRHGGRPWVVLNMIASVDGATAVDGVSGGLGGPGDRAVFSALRKLADVVLVGAATVRAEGYQPPRREGQRIAVVTRSADLDWSSALFRSGAAIVVTAEDGPDVPVDSVRAGRGELDLAAAVAKLPGEVVLAEGGPSLNAQLLAAGCIDELCVTVSPRAVGGTAKRIATGPDGSDHRLELLHVLEEDGFLFTRYRA
jgi:riboflavin biosynthesis pyrimidine reductase